MQWTELGAGDLIGLIPFGIHAIIYQFYEVNEGNDDRSFWDMSRVCASSAEYESESKSESDTESELEPESESEPETQLYVSRRPSIYRNLNAELNLSNLSHVGPISNENNSGNSW